MPSPSAPASRKAFGPWSAAFLGIGSMVGAGVFIVIGEAGAIAGSLVTVSFLLAGGVALACGYSLSRLAIRYPSRGGMIEYLVQAYGEGYLSGAFGILFYLAQLVAIAAVAESFGTYASTLWGTSSASVRVDLLAVGILSVFVVVNLAGAAVVARAENSVVLFKLGALGFFTVAAFFTIEPSRLAFGRAVDWPAMLSTLGLTFFAFQGFSVITNAVEDMEDAPRTIVQGMVRAIAIVTVLYVTVSLAVFGNLNLKTIVRDQDFALAEALRPVFGAWGFRLMAVTALVATASAINATLYATTQIGYTLAKRGNLPKVYEYNVFHNSEGLIVSALLILPMILFLNLGEIATLASIIVLLVQGVTHLGHLRRVRETGAHPLGVAAAVLGSFTAAGFAIEHAASSGMDIAVWVAGMFGGAFALEIALRVVSGRRIERQVWERLLDFERKWSSGGEDA